MEIIGAFIVLGIFGAVSGGVCMAVLCGLATWITRGMPERVPASAKAVWISLASAAWFCLIAVVWANCQSDFVHLPNGYSIRQDENSRNLLLNLKTQGNGKFGTAAAWDTVGDVSQLQIAGPYILGVGDNFGQGSRSIPGTYFLLDSRTGHIVTFSGNGTMVSAAHKLGIVPQLEPIGTIISRYSPSLAPWLVAALLLPLAVWLLWLHRLLRLRESWRQKLA